MKKIITTALMFSSLSSFALEVEEACGTFSANTTTERALMLVGGGEANTPAEEPATRWLLNKGGGGDLLVLRSGGTGSQAAWLCDTFQSGGELSSAYEASVDSRADASSTQLLDLVAAAEIIFIAGGDQNKYEDFWKGTPLADALNLHLQTKPIAGTSAGMAILGASYYAPSGTAVIGSEILNDPYHANTRDIFHGDFIQHPFMADTILETHLDRKIDRETRHSRIFGLLARSWADNNYTQTKYAIALDEGTFFAVGDDWRGTVFGNEAFFLVTNGVVPEQMQAGSKLVWDTNAKAVDVYKIQGTANGSGEFDLFRWTGQGGEWMYWYTTNGYRKFNCKRGC